MVHMNQVSPIPGPVDPVRSTVTGAGRPEAPDHKRGQLGPDLAKLNPAFEELYATAVEHLQRGTGGMGRIVNIANCVREIANNLATVVSDAGGTALPPRVDMSAPIRQLCQAWESAQLGVVDELVTRSGADGTSDLIDGIEDGRIDRLRYLRVPVEVYKAAQAVVAADRQAAENARNREAAAIGRTEVDNDATAQLWSSTISFFSSYAHLDRAATRAVPSEEELNSRFATFESIVGARLADFFVIKSEIDDLLALTNQRRDPNKGLDPSSEDDR